MQFKTVLWILIRWICNKLLGPDPDPYYLSKIQRNFRKKPEFFFIFTVKAGNFVTFFALFNFFLKNSFR